MLWLTFTARNICKDVSKDLLRAHNRNGPAQTRNKPTILSCWMAWEPCLGGFYAPMSLLVLVMSMYFLCTYIQLKRHPERKYELRVLSEEQQQLSSSKSNHQCHTDTRGASGLAADCPSFATGVSLLANEHSFKSQLRATAFTLFLFLLTWALGALAVSLGHFLDMIFSCLYGAFCVTLGLFLLIQHCAKRDDVWQCWWACCPSKSKTEDENGNGQSLRQELHQPHYCVNSPCSGKLPLLSAHLVQSSYNKTAPPQSVKPSHTGPCCVAVMTPVATPPVSPLAEPVPSPRPQSFPEELPHPTVSLQSCLTDRTKSHSFNCPHPCLQDYRSHMTSTSMDGSVYSSHLDSPYTAQSVGVGSPLLSNNPHLDLQLPCPSPHLDKQQASWHSLQCQNSCHSIQDSMTSCHRHAHNMHDSIMSCHSLLLPSHGVHSCQWHMYNSTNHCSTTSCSEKPIPFTVQYQQDPDTYSCVSKTTEKEKESLCVEMEQKGFPRNTLPRQHGAISRRGTIGRNRSLQEDATENIRTGPWKNETTV
ncbi:hypothetical protein PAMA_012888 [Pampus argenteus]